jgi:hypothetical protein
MQKNVSGLRVLAAVLASFKVLLVLRLVLRALLEPEPAGAALALEGHRYAPQRLLRQLACEFCGA